MSFEMTPLSRACKFHCNHVCISSAYRFWAIQRQIVAWPWNLG